MKKIDIDDLQTGDILLLTPPKEFSYISWAITFLTKSKVSHAAMLYNKEKNSVVEQVLPKARFNDLMKFSQGRKLLVCRFKEYKDPSPVMQAASSYVDKDNPYSMKNLYLVGYLLLYKRFTPNTAVKRAMIRILKKIIEHLSDIINEKGQKPMVCSQFVAQCHEDAGPKYQINIIDGVLSQQDGSVYSVLDLALNKVGEDVNTPLKAINLTKEKNTQSEEELCKELYVAFHEQDQSLLKSSPEVSQELLETVCALAEVHDLYIQLHLGNTTHSDKSLNEKLLILEKDKSLFITPEDLLNNAPDLEQVGIIEDLIET